MRFSKSKMAGIVAATAAAAYGIYRFRRTDDTPATDEDAPAAA